MTALSSDSVTTARCFAGHRATKLIRATPDGGFAIEGYDAGWLFDFAERPVSGLSELANVLTEVAADPRRFVIRGEPLPGIDLGAAGGSSTRTRTARRRPSARCPGAGW